MHRQNILEQYLQYMSIAGYKQDARKHYGYAVSEFLHWLEANNIAEIADVSPAEIKAYYEYLRIRPNKLYAGTLSEKTVFHRMSAIRVLFNYYEQTGMMSKNPMSGLIFPKPFYRRRESLKQGDIKELYEASKTMREKALLGMYYGCGLRKTEGVRLNANDIHHRERLLYVRAGKGDKRRVVPVSERVANDFYDYYHEERDGYIKDAELLPDASGIPFMLNARGGRMRGMVANRLLKEIVKRTGNKSLKEKRICIHTLRHSIATHFLENGLSVEHVRDFLGHKKLETTQLYTHISEHQIQKLTAL